MTRDLERLVTDTFDVVVIGGGIYGACVAWDAALRGLSVALLEQGDFGHATSANSMKIMHGGFRYLQHGDVKRMRESINERRIFMRIAPHLVHPLPFLLPTYRTGIQRRQIMRAALAVYDLVAWDRNFGVRDPGKRIPRGRVVSRDECLKLAPGISDRGLTGGAVWQDGQVYNTERLTLAFLRSAAARGSCAANYVRVTGMLQEGRRVTGVLAVDAVTRRTLEVRARLVINTSGPWVSQVFQSARSPGAAWTVSFTKTMNLVTKPLTGRHGVSVTLPHRAGAQCREAGCCRRLYFTPWRGRTVAGSLHVPVEGPADRQGAREDEIARLLADLNAAYPAAALTREDVSLVHVGLLPRDAAVLGARVSADHLSDHYEIRDHAKADGVEGVLSVVGVKYTTARDVAEKVIALALTKLGRTPAASRSAVTPLHGGDIDRFDEFLAGVLQARPHGLAEDILRQLVYSYGSVFADVLEQITRNPQAGERVAPSSPVIKAQVLYAVREEMARTLSDVVFRRTELGSLGHPGQEALRTCADLMAAELGWDAARRARELEETEQLFPARRPAPHAAAR